MNKIKAMLSNQPIKSKIISIYIPLIIIPLLLLGWLSNYIYTKAVLQETKKTVKDESVLITDRIDYMIRSCESSAKFLTKELNNYAGAIEKGPEDNSINSLIMANEITGILQYVILQFPEIDSIAFIDNNFNIYYSNKSLIKNIDNFKNSQMLDKINNSNGANIWFPMQKRDFLTLNSDAPVLTLGKKIVNINTAEQIGELVINIKESSIFSIYKDIGITESRRYFIIDNDERLVSSEQKENLLSKVEISKYGNMSSMTGSTIVKFNDGVKYLLTATKMERLDWTLVSEISINELTKNTKRLTLFVLGIGIVCVIVGIIGSGVLSGLIVNPIIILKEKMRTVKNGDLNVRCEVKNKDEVGMLAEGFNSMIEKIGSLLSNIKEEQKKKREYELALIQAQIKPHFLYNTLDLIYVLCFSGNYTECGNTTKALADFYRTALSNGKEIITINEEIKNVKDYLYIQKNRYSDIFDFEINVQEDILNNEIIKLTLQPLVENSIYHGLREKAGKGKITVTGLKENGKIIISVADDGIGISQEKLFQIFSSQDEKEKIAFGLRSVDNRIKLYFGEEYGIAVTSELGKGTQVRISIPEKEVQY